MRRRRTAVAAALLVLTTGALGTACSRDDGPAAPRTTTTQAGPPATLPFSSVSQAELARQAGLVLPAGTADFLTAQLQNRAQLDVTFTLPADQAAAFVTDSNLKEPVAGKRVVTHTSPLWKLNADGEIRGTVRTGRRQAPAGGRTGGRAGRTRARPDGRQPSRPLRATRATRWPEAVSAAASPSACAVSSRPNV